MTKKFNPSDIGLDNGNMYGLPYSVDEAKVVIVPVPWEVTTSYRDGTARGPQAILDASVQVDVYDADAPDAWKLGLAMLPISKKWAAANARLRPKAKRCIQNLEKGGSPSDANVKKLYAEINRAGTELNTWVEKETSRLLNAGKSVCVLGGEHSVPLGFMKALARVHPHFSILHIDAHADSREAYEGFTYSHASIMYNASQLTQVDRIVLAGIRDYCQEEADRIAASRGRIVAFPDRDLKRNGFAGQTWKQQSKKITDPLSDNVYISFDIDALDPSLCPHTGTPVPGGFAFEEICFVIETLVSRGKTIIGFDLSEVAPHPGEEWDASVGARMLYRLVNFMAKSQGKL
ncbi:MAG: agmatinase family protein [Candidatus Kerfeldbacteria bacterium]|nr:agmatinase family protein [Candidatus Kerfeldbacteria bacterium]